jgi:hypothetical protein
MMIIAKPQHTTPRTYAPRCILNLFALATLGLAASAQQPTAAPPPPRPGAMMPPATGAKQMAETQETRHRGLGEGIKVHGHWKITVHDPDGKFVKEVEFENSLVTPDSADNVLSQMMAGQFALAGFTIVAQPSNLGTGGVCNQLGGPWFCVIVPGAVVDNSTLIQTNWCKVNGSGTQNQYCFPGLMQTYVPYNATTQAASYLQLTGSLTALNSSDIKVVQTGISGCQTTALSTLSNATCSLVANEPNWPAGTIY